MIQMGSVFLAFGSDEVCLGPVVDVLLAAINTMDDTGRLLARTIADIVEEIIDDDLDDMALKIEIR